VAATIQTIQLVLGGHPSWKVW